jgi:hypothetical protein
MKVGQHTCDIKAHNFLFNFVPKNYFTWKVKIWALAYHCTMHAMYIWQWHMIKSPAYYIHHMETKGKDKALTK